MLNIEGRAWPSLLFFCAGLSLLAASISTARWYQWGGVALLLLACAPWRSLPSGSLGAITGAYCGWLFVNAVFITPAYGAEAIYQPLMLLGAFVALATMDRGAGIQLFRAGVALISALVLLGLLQYYFGVWHLPHNPQRAAGTFVTPSTFATAINLFLLPLTALYLVSGSRRAFWLALWLFAGLAASASRGGMLAFLAGLAFVAICVGPPDLWHRRRRVLNLVAGWLAVWIVIALAAAFVLSAGDARATSPAQLWLDRGTAERPDLYAAALGLILDRPVTGAGANMFFPLFEIVKPESLRALEFIYAHNDYLQIWLEFGAPGVVLLIALIYASLAIAWRAFRRAPQEAMPLACGGALASCFAHAMVDFPLYVPFVLLVAGAYLGVLAAHAGDSRVPVVVQRLAARLWLAITPAIRWALALAALAWLAQPMLADVAVQRSIQLLARGEALDGIYWQSVARRLEPRHPVHYWAEGTIWQHQTEISRNPLHAAQADALFAEGIRDNRYDSANLTARVMLHRRFPELMKNAATPAELLSWSERAAGLRPHNLSVQAELARTLAHVGQRERARGLARRLLALHPEANLAKRLVAELRG